MGGACRTHWRDEKYVHNYSLIYHIRFIGVRVDRGEYFTEVGYEGAD
jgi:hypothetical protein